MASEKPFRVAVLNSKHIFETHKDLNGEILPTSGVGVKFLDLLSQCMDFKYNIVVPKDGEFGRKLNDGHWTGMIGMTVRGEADFAVNMIAFTSVRNEVLNFSYPYQVDGTHFITETPGLLPKGLVYFHPFSKALWVSVMFTIIAAPIIFKFVFRNLHSFHKLFFQVIGSFLGLPFEIAIRGYSQSILCISWLFYVKVLALCYCAVLLSFVTVPLKEPDIHSVDQLANVVLEGKHRCHIFSGTSDQEAFYSATSGPLKIIADYVKKNNMLVSHGKTITDYIPDSKTALIGSKSLIQFNYLKDNYRHVVSEESFYTTLIAIPVQKHFCCLHRMNTCIHRINSGGLYKKFLNDEIYMLRAASSLKQNFADRDTILTISDIYGAFFILIGGYIVSFIAFFVEKVCKRKRYKITSLRVNPRR